MRGRGPTRFLHPGLLALAAAALAFVGAVVVHLVAFTERGHALDRAVLRVSVELGPGGGKGPPDMLPHVVDEVPTMLLAAVMTGYALLRRSPVLGLALGFAVLGANLTTVLLKPLLEVPRPVPFLAPQDQISAHAWPSGHATAVVSLAAAAAASAPTARRAAVAISGALVTAIVCLCLVIAAWHYPSDVLGGCLVALVWTLLAVGAARIAASRFELPQPKPRRP